ncbi:BA14K family protein [Mesorhizobium sp. LHD-90]|uniref:BA14K family protein n=1 Tax=Mesorhizobium sp. LHD-90 TaxID=3071414 RepID=UPI0027E0AC40|nr:BA14K family protein [Mesorhizobium sp. LHD-90]MDQ6433571.1 BA14K family protein [Mesorhizobium sp. LHD-90]
MITAFSTLARAGVIALGVLTGVTGGASSAPIGPVVPQSPAASTGLAVVPVVEGEFRGGTNPIYRNWRGGGRQWRGNREWRGGRHWRGDDGWRGGNRHWRGDREWRRDRYWRGDRGWRRDRRWARRNYWRDNYRYGSGIYLGFGVPYYGAPYYGYADPGYYAAPRYYRAPVRANSHTQWCYARYRSYRAYDNTFQPYYGPRRECISPFI